LPNPKGFVKVFAVTTIYRLHADELDSSLLESLKAAFKGKEIEIAVTEHDETAYLLSTPANRERLLRSIANVEAGKNIVTPDQSLFE
jgi:antitoxin YefM